MASISCIYQHKEEQAEFLNKMVWKGPEGSAHSRDTSDWLCCCEGAFYIGVISPEWIPTWKLPAELCLDHVSIKEDEILHGELRSVIFFPEWDELQGPFQPKPFCECCKFCNFCSSLLQDPLHGTVWSSEKWEMKIPLKFSWTSFLFLFLLAVLQLSGRFLK